MRFFSYPFHSIVHSGTTLPRDLLAALKLTMDVSLLTLAPSISTSTPPPNCCAFSHSRGALFSLFFFFVVIFLITHQPHRPPCCRGLLHSHGGIFFLFRRLVSPTAPLSPTVPIAAPHTLAVSLFLLKISLPAWTNVCGSQVPVPSVQVMASSRETTNPSKLSLPGPSTSDVAPCVEPLAPLLCSA